MLPLVTVVTPSFNQARFLRATIESVLSQDYPHLEYLILDGGSTDGSNEIAAEYAGRLVYTSQPDRGQSHAINLGFQRARGEILCWINSDDILLPGAVRAAVEALEAHPTAAALYGAGICLDENGNTLGPFPYTAPFNLWRLTHLCSPILQQSVFFRRQPLADLGYLDESLHYSMDWDLLIRLGQRYGLLFLDKPLGALREYPNTKTALGGPARLRAHLEILRRHTKKTLPGTLFHLFDTYDKIWPAHLGPLSQPAFRLCRFLHDVASIHSQGYYQNGWAGRRLHWMLPASAHRATLRGEIPAWAPPSVRLRLWSQGRPVERRLLPPGPFTWHLERPPSSLPWTLRFDASWFALGPAGSDTPYHVPVSWRISSFEPE